MDGNSTDKALSSKPIGCITLTFITYPKFLIEKYKYFAQNNNGTYNQILPSRQC